MDCRREGDSKKETLRGEKGKWLGKSETNPEHIVGTKNGAMGARTIRRLEATKRSETSLLLEIQGVPWDLVPNAPRRGRRKRHPTLAPVLPPVHATAHLRHHQRKLRENVRST